MSTARTTLIGVATLVAIATTPATAGAVALTGLTSITIEGKAASGLKAAKVSTGVGGSAQLVGKTRIVLPARSGTVVSSGIATVQHAGSIVLRRTTKGQRRVATLSGLRLELGKRRTITASLSGRRITLFSLDLRQGEYTTTAVGSSVQVNSTRAILTADAAKRIATRLGAPRVTSGLYGVVTTNAGAPVAGSTTPGRAPSPGPAAPGASTTPAPVTVPAPAPGPGAVAVPDPGDLTRPASAVDVTSSALEWRVRDSFIRYINGEAAPTASGGATAASPRVAAGSSTALTYEYGFAPAGGWYDPVSGKARLSFRGKVTFTFASHGIDFDVIDPEVELDGANSRVVATFGGRRATALTGRGVLMHLDTSAVSPVVSGQARTFSSIPGVVPPETISTVFAGFYAAGDPFGSIGLSFTTAS